MHSKVSIFLACLFCFVVVRIASTQDLPADAAALVAENQKVLADIERKAVAQMQAANDQLQAKLEKLKVDYTKEGKLDEAVAIRDFLRAGVGAKVIKPISDPGNLTAYGSEVGRVLLIEVTGAVGSAVYGTDVYTHDSNLAPAAVHAGVLKLGEKGIVKVTILPPQDGFAGTGRNGITSTGWTSAKYDCYKIEPVKTLFAGVPATSTVTVAAADVRPDPGNLGGYRNQVGNSFVFEVTGANDWGIYGTDIYTDDSELDVVAVHAGLLKVGQKGLVKVTVLGSQTEFKSTSRNGVTSRSWAGFSGSYKVEPASKLEAIKEAVKEINGVKDALNAVDSIKDALKK